MLQGRNDQFSSPLPQYPLSIRLRLLLLVIAAGLPAVIALGLLGQSTYAREAEVARASVRQLGDSLKSAVERELDKRAVLAQTLAAAVELREPNVVRFHEEATAATRDSGGWTILLDRTSILATTLPSVSELTPLRRLSSSFVTGPPSVFFYKQGLLLKRPVLAVVAPAPGIASPRFNVGVGFEPAAIQAVMEQFLYPEGAVAAVIDKGGFVIARSHEPARWLGASASEDERRRALTGEAGFAESATLDGMASLSYMTSTDRYGWNVVIALPQSALTAAAQQVTFRFVAASGLLLFIGLGLALHASRHISGAVHALSRAATQLGEDAVPAQLATGVSEADEVIGALHHAGLRARQAEVVLERRVAQAVRIAEKAQAAVMEERKHEAIGRLAGGLAHDFNNLLQTITTALQLLDRTIGDSPHRGVLDAAIRASAKAANLIRQMLAFGRPQSLQPQPVDLADFILKNRDLAGSTVGSRVRMKVSLEENLPPLLLDPTQLQLATLNLVFNADQSMARGGNLVITGRLARPEETAALGKGHFVCLEVADDGPGMTPDVLEKAFEPYFTTKAVGAGNGLGLSQVLSFARQSGGDIRLRTVPGQGTQACLILPASNLPPAVSHPVAQPVAQAAETTSGSIRRRPLRILMVEDDILLSSVVIPALQGEGHEIFLCATADEAVGVLSDADRFDVLFTDVVMPGRMTGMDLVAWCRIHRPSLPAVVASGYTAQAADAVQVLRKPYSIDALLDALQRAVDLETATGAVAPS